MALYVEAAHDAALRAALTRGRSVLEQRLRPAFAALGAPDPDLAVQALATSFGGMFLHMIAQHAPMDARRLIDLVVGAALGLPPHTSCPGTRRQPGTGRRSVARSTAGRDHDAQRPGAAHGHACSVRAAALVCR